MDKIKREKDDKRERRKMKNSTKMMICACGICACSAWLLFTAMELHAISNISAFFLPKTATTIIEENSEDVVANSISEFGEGVRIRSLTEAFIEEGWVDEENPSDSESALLGTVLTPAEDELTREEAVQIGMNEITRLFGENSYEGMTATMVLEDPFLGTDMEGNHLWSGELVNLEKENVNNSMFFDYYYTFSVDAKTGELYSCTKEIGEKSEYMDLVEKMTDEEILSATRQVVVKYNLLEDEQLAEIEFDKAHKMWGDYEYMLYNESDYLEYREGSEVVSYYENDVTFYLDNKQKLQVFFDWQTGVFEGYWRYVENKNHITP